MPEFYDPAEQRAYDYYKEVDDGSSWSLLSEQQRDCYWQSAERLYQRWIAPTASPADLEWLSRAEVLAALGAFVAAEAERVRTIEVYNTVLTDQRERGIFPPKVWPEEDVMEAARKTFWDAQKHLLTVAARSASLTATPGGEA